MIIAYRLFHARENQGVFQGVNFFVCQDLVLPLSQLPNQAMSAFLAALKRQELDSEATRIAVPGFAMESPLTRFNTAREAAMRALPERYRPASRLFTAALAKDRPDGQKVLYLNTPPWLRLHTEEESGEIFELRPAASANAQWQRIALNGAERYLHFTFFEGPAPTPRIETFPQQNENYYRAGDLVAAALDPALAPCLSLRVDGAA